MSEALKSPSLRPVAAGSSSIKLHQNARRSLSISVVGIGNVATTGSANVKTAIAGSGSVKKL